jgi:cytochrome c553
MAERTDSPFRHPLAPRSIALTAAIFLVAALLGFVLFPLLQPNAKVAGLWDAICSAAGIARKPSASEPVALTFKVSGVVATAQILNTSDPQSVGRGATLAHQCAICHGPTGKSLADAPNLAGQYARAIYKELNDFKSDARSNAIMAPIAAELSDQDVVDVARYYASLSRSPGDVPPTAVTPPVIAINGAPLRNIPPCGACHGSIDHTAVAPHLEGQPAAYIKAQLQAFVASERHNDVNEQMRNVARQMTPAEMDAVANYYSSLQ